jgi:hypothetical protein
MNFDNTTLGDVNTRKSTVVQHSGNYQTISTISRLWEPLVYPLFFPHSTLGWGIVGSQSDLHDKHDNLGNSVGNITINADVCGRQIMFYRARILCEPCFRVFGKLTNQYAVDMWTRNLKTRLNYIRENQKRVMEEDVELMGETFIPESQNIYLPSSFMGSKRWATEQIADSLTIAAHLGSPTFFVTMTCNTDWPEIKTRLRPGQDFSDISYDVVSEDVIPLSALPF